MNNEKDSNIRSIITIAVGTILVMGVLFAIAWGAAIKWHAKETSPKASPPKPIVTAVTPTLIPPTAKDTLAPSLPVDTAEVVGTISIPKAGKRLQEIEREAILTTLELAGHDEYKAARILGVSRLSMARMMKADGIPSTLPAPAPRPRRKKP